jgi:hypothetical protein
LPNSLWGLFRSDAAWYIQNDFLGPLMASTVPRQFCGLMSERLRPSGSESFKRSWYQWSSSSMWRNANWNAVDLQCSYRHK